MPLHTAGLTRLALLFGTGALVRLEDDVHLNTRRIFRQRNGGGVELGSNVGLADGPFRVQWGGEARGRL